MSEPKPSAAPPEPDFSLELAGSLFLPGETLAGTLHWPDRQNAAPLELTLFTRLRTQGSFVGGQADYPLCKLEHALPAGPIPHFTLAFILPLETPVNLFPASGKTNELAHCPVWLQIRQGEARCGHPLHIATSRLMRQLFAVLEKSGLAFRDSHVERGTVCTSYGSSALGCFQVFDFEKAIADSPATADNASVSFVRSPGQTIAQLDINAERSDGGYISLLMEQSGQSLDWEPRLQHLLQR